MPGDIIEAPKPNIVVRQSGPIDIAGLIKTLVDAGATQESVAAIRDLAALHREIRADDAREMYAQAFVAMQAEMPKVPATKPIPDNHGNIRYHIAPYEEIYDKVQPVMARHGFSVTYSADYREQPLRVVMKCTLTHAAGHSTVSEASARVGKGPPGSSDAQADGAAMTYAKRYAFCNALNIAIEHDTDARSEGETIDADEAADLDRRVGTDPAKRARILRLAGAASFAEIRRAKYEVVLDHLERERPQTGGTTTPAPTVSTAATTTIPDPPCGYEGFADAGDWRNAMLEAFKGRGSSDPVAAFDTAVKKSGCSSYIAVPAERRRAAWKALHEGKLDPK